MIESLMLAGTVTQVLGSLVGGAAKMGAAKAQANALRRAGQYEAAREREASAYSLKIGEFNALAAIEHAAAKAVRMRRDHRRRLSTSTVRAAASGTTQSGSILAVYADQAMEAEEEVQLVLHEGRLDAARARVDSGLLARQHTLNAIGAEDRAETGADAARSAGRAGMIGGLFGAASGGISGYTALEKYKLGTGDFVA